MSDDSQRNSAFNAAANLEVHHAQLSDIQQFTPEKLGHLRRGGIRSGGGRTDAQTQQMLDKVPPSQRAGIDGKSAASKVKEYLADKQASHITPHNKGGSSHPDNIKWENKTANQARRDKQMTRQEQMQLDGKARIDNLTGAWKAGLEAAPKGAVIGAVTTAPFSMLRNALRVVRGEISAQDAAIETVKETAIGGGIGAATAFTITTVATACPSVAIALTAVSPILLAAGGVGMVYEFFGILGKHDRQLKAYYKTRTKQEIQHLKRVDAQLAYEHKKNLQFLSNAKMASAIITDRPRLGGLDEAFSRLCDSIKIAKSLNAKPVNKKLLEMAKNSQKYLSSSKY